MDVFYTLSMSGRLFYQGSCKVGRNKISEEQLNGQFDSLKIRRDKRVTRSETQKEF